MSRINENMSIPQFLDILDLDQLQLVKNQCAQRINKIEGEEKVSVYVFNSGCINEGFYRSEIEAVSALKEYVNSKEYDPIDVLSIIKIKEHATEAERLLSN